MALLNEDFSKGAIACGARRRLAAFVLGPHVLLRHRSHSHATDAKNADYPKQQSKRDSDYIAHVEHRSKDAVEKQYSCGLPNSWAHPRGSTTLLQEPETKQQCRHSDSPGPA